MSMATPQPLVQVMHDLIKGQEFATQLQGLLRDSPKAGLIMDQILHTFSRVIDAAKAAARTGSGGGGEGSDVQSEVTCGGGSGGRKRKAAAGGGDRRGACRRRTQQSSVVTTMKSMEDGQTWRKYGQKDIQNSKYPKSYFRCTHKFDQQCAAQRQVQRCDEDPDTLRVTYIGVHTCREPAAVVVPHVIHHTGAADGDQLHDGCHIISFGPSAGAAAATPATTTSTTTTMTVNTNQASEGALIGSGLQSLKLEGGDQEEVLSSTTPGCSAVRSTSAAAAAAYWPDLGDVTSTLHYGDGLGEFLDDYTYGLEDIVQYDLGH